MKSVRNARSDVSISVTRRSENTVLAFFREHGSSEPVRPAVSEKSARLRADLGARTAGPAPIPAARLGLGIAWEIQTARASAYGLPRPLA
jgi:hypothetical protein